MNFNTVPSNTLIPLFHAEVSNRAANIFQNTGRVLLTGISKLPGDEIPFLATDELLVITKTGAGSQCHRMYKRFKAGNVSTEVWIFPVVENSAGVKATGSLTVTGPATADGILNLYVNGVRVQAPVANGDTASAIASALATAINSNSILPATAAATDGTVTLTATQRGAWGNNIPVEMNLNGADAGEITPAGVGVEISVFENGAGDPDLTEKLASLGDREYDFIANPFCDTVNLDAWRTFMNDVTGRWSDGQQIYGHVYSFLNGTVSAAQTFGSGRNDQHMCIGAAQGLRQLPDEWLAALVAKTSMRFINDPARPCTFLELAGIIPPREGDMWDKSSRNTLLHSGISTFVFNNGAVQIERLVTTYQKNQTGEADISYRAVNTMYTLQYIIRRLRSVILSKYPDYKLADDGYAGFDGAIVTPGIIKAEILSVYHDMCVNAPVVCENEDAFAEALVVQRNASDPDRIDAYVGPDLVNQFMVFAALVEFRLNY